VACFTDLATVKAALGITGTESDVVLQAIVDGANAEMLRFFYLTDCGPTQYTSAYDVVDDVGGIWLQQYPVISVDSVSVDGTVQDAATYYLDSRVGDFGHLRRKFGGSISAPACWPVGPRVVSVTHTAGWAGGTPPADLQRAATLLAIYDWNTGVKQGFQSERIGQYSYTLGSAASVGQGFGGAGAGGYPAPVARILAGYKRPFAEGG
jgi:hypothetical protein